MFPSNDYTPILKGRDGEYGALAAMNAEDKELITPMVEIPPVPWDHANGVPEKTIDQHLAKVDAKIENSWGPDQPFFLDLLRIGDEERMADGSHPLAHLFSRLRLRTLKSVPVTGLIRAEDYQAACRDIVKTDKRGICLRLQRDDFEEQGDLEITITKLLAMLRVCPTDTDLVLDLGALRADGEAPPSIDAISLVKSVPLSKKWRSFIFVATGFPVNLMGLPPSETTPVPRLEWFLWCDVVADSRIARTPAFGDYGVAHPQPEEVDPRVMRPSASIRYTTDDAWLILKGKNLKTHGFKQFHDVSKNLTETPAYSGRQFSWGDRYISDCANRMVGTGNLTTWRKVGTSHHIAHVTHQIASHAST
jgi:Beta protein